MIKWTWIVSEFAVLILTCLPMFCDVDGECPGLSSQGPDDLTVPYQEENDGDPVDHHEDEHSHYLQNSTNENEERVDWNHVKRGVDNVMGLSLQAGGSLFSRLPWRCRSPRLI